MLVHLIIALAWLSGVQSAAELTQSGAVVIKSGESHTMTCKASGFTFSSYDMHWVRQFPSGELQWVSRISNPSGSNKYFHDSVKGRFTISRDNSNSLASLKMDNMKTEDSAVYYCARHSGGYFDLWSKGSYVEVTTATQLGPSLFPLISCDASQGQSTAIGCLARNFFPNTIQLNWTNKDNSSSGLDSITQYTLKSGETYTASSQVKVLTVNWENNDPYYCTATHTSTNTVWTVKLQNRKVVAVPRKPIVTIHPPFKDDVENTGNATIACVVTGFYPKDIDVSWMKNHELPPHTDTVIKGPVSEVNGSFMITSYITVPKLDWDKDTAFSCVVNHAPSDFHEIKNVSNTAVCDFQSSSGKIKVTVEPPSFETIYLQNIAPLTCIVSNMDTKDGLEVSWYANKEKIPTVLEDPVFDSAVQKFRARAISSVCPEDWRTKSFVCSVTHPELPQVTNVDLTKPNGQDAKAPTVLLFPPHQDELAKKETATLTCLVKGFYPSDLFVKWMDSDSNEYFNFVTTEPKEEITSGKKKFFLISTLTLQSVEEWNSGKVYTCLVGHESLPLHITQKSIDKTAARMIYIDEDDEIDNLWTTASTFIVLFLLSLFYSATVTLFKVK